MKTEALLTLLMLFSASAIAAEIPPSLTTPDKVETRIGTLDFKDGAQNKETLDKLYDNLDFTYAFRAFTRDGIKPYPPTGYRTLELHGAPASTT